MTTTKMTFTINNNVRDIQFVGSETHMFRVWITGEKGLGVKEIQDFNTCKGILHAFTDLALVRRYNTHLQGLHLRPSISRLAGEIIMEEVGYVSNHYAGVIPVDGLAKLNDENPLATNWGVVSFKNGRMNVVKKLTYIAGTKTESDEVKHERHAIDLMNGFEIVNTNCSLSLVPLTKSRTSVSTGEYTSGRDVISRSLTVALQVLQAPDQNAATEMIGDRVAKKQVFTTFARLNAAATRAEEAGKTFEVNLATVMVIKDRKTMEISVEPASILKGMMGYLFKGKYATGGIQALDNPIVMGMIKAQNLSVLIAE